VPAATVLYKAREITEHLIESRFVASVFKVKVVTPLRLADESERFPVVYATDSDEFFGGLSTLAYELQLLAETPRFILVAIGYGMPVRPICFVCGIYSTTRLGFISNR